MSGMSGKTLGQCLDELQVERKKPLSQRLAESGNVWKIDERGNLYLQRDNGSDAYWIPAEDLRKEEVLDWMTQLSEKTWVSSHVLGDLYRAFLLVLGDLR